MTNHIINDTIISYGYNANGNMTQKSLNNGVTTSYSYNNGGMLTGMTNYKANTVYSTYSCEYLPNGLKTSETENGVQTKNYAYDKFGRLTNETVTDTQDQTTLNQSYAYDLSGNRVSMTGNDGVFSYTYDANNRMLNKTKSVNGSIAEKTDYFYDPNGNTVSERTTRVTSEAQHLAIGSVGDGIETNIKLYEYDAFNQLKSYTDSHNKVTYAYNADNLRTNKTVNGTSTAYTWNGNNLVMEKSAKTNVYGYDLTGVATANLDGNIRYYLKNSHGDVTDLLDSSGTVTSSYDNDAFGVETNTVDTDTNPFRYCGEYTDAESGMIYLRNRYYEPDSGRFVNEDPHWNIGNMIYGDSPSKDNPTPDISAIMQSANLYIYGMNNPIRWIDPSGKIVTDWDRAVLTKAQVDRIQYITDNWNSASKKQKGIWRDEVKGYRSKCLKSDEYTDDSGITRSRVTNGEIKFKISDVNISSSAVLHIRIAYSFNDKNEAVISQSHSNARIVSDSVVSEYKINTKSFTVGTLGGKQVISWDVGFTVTMFGLLNGLFEASSDVTHAKGNFGQLQSSSYPLCNNVGIS
ncbi:MAG: RHS repeat-associated core domain-containing protein [Bacillota bacterium]|nr:RHS repeat-associated core domain-containing protein [Bacillota bacterium]